MRTLLKVSIPVKQGNIAIKNGTLSKVIEGTMAKIKPEGAYFMTFEGKRTAFFFFDMNDVSEIPQIGEPFFMELNAEVELLPVMNGEELQKGLSAAMAKSVSLN